MDGVDPEGAEAVKTKSKGDAMRMKQQGDVLLKSVDGIPEGSKKVDPTQRGYVLAEGEHTGHMHRLEDIENVEMFEKDGKLFVRVKKPTVLIHEEHKPVTIDPGCWGVGIVREYDHFTKEARRVQD